MAGILGFVGGAVMGASSGGPEGSADASTSAPPGGTPGDTGTSTDDESPEASPESEEGDYTITLIASPTSAAPNDRIDLQGNLEPPVEGVTLVVQRRLGEDGEWQSFGTSPVEAETRDDGSFSTWVQTGREGRNDFRLVGEIDGQPVESEAATVTIEGSGDDDDDDDD